MRAVVGGQGHRLHCAKAFYSGPLLRREAGKEMIALGHGFKMVARSDPRPHHGQIGNHIIFKKDRPINEAPCRA